MGATRNDDVYWDTTWNPHNIKTYTPPAARPPSRHATRGNFVCLVSFMHGLTTSTRALPPFISHLTTRLHISLSWSFNPQTYSLTINCPPYKIKQTISLSLSLAFIASLPQVSLSLTTALSHFPISILPFSSCFFFFSIFISFSTSKIGNHFPFPILLIWISRRFYLQCFFFFINKLNFLLRKFIP